MSRRRVPSGTVLNDEQEDALGTEEGGPEEPRRDLTNRVGQRARLEPTFRRIIGGIAAAIVTMRGKAPSSSRGKASPSSLAAPLERVPPASRRPRRLMLAGALPLAGAAALLMLVTACSFPSRPLWWTHAKPPAHAVGDRFSGDRAASVLVVRDPWNRGMRQLGIQVYWTANSTDSSDAVIRAKAQRIIDYAISLNANSVAVTFPFFTYGLTSDTLYAKPGVTPSPGHIAIFLAAAAAAHIRVTLRPVLNEDVLVAQNPLAWRGTIEPTNRAAWFQSYRTLLLPYLRVAQAGHAATFVLGSELDSLEGDPQWRGLVRSLRSVYSGQLTFDQNFDVFAMGITNLPVPTHDVDAYPRFDLPDDAPVALLAQFWDAWLGAHPLSMRRNLVLSEIGIDAVAGSYLNPGAWIGIKTASIDPRMQAAWFQAVCDAVSAEQIGGGIYWWEVNFDADPADPGPYMSDRLTFLDRPAQQVIQNCFAKLSS